MPETHAKTDHSATYVFLGPSLPRSRAISILKAHYHPPIQRGDLLRVVDQGARLIGIIDGAFYRTFSVSPFEIVSALRRGVRIFGASSMGALKAVECAPFGMIGIGRIFEWYQKGKIDAEDEVALVFHPTTLQAMSVPLVNMRYALDLAEKEKILTQNEKNYLLRMAKKIYFPERTYEKLFEMVKDKKALGKKLGKLKRYVETESKDLKALDAIACLDAIRKAQR